MIVYENSSVKLGAHVLIRNAIISSKSKMPLKSPVNGPTHFSPKKKKWFCPHAVGSVREYGMV